MFKQLVSNPRGSLLRKLQEFLMSYMGYSIPLFNPIPQFRYVKTIIGEPISIPKILNPKVDDIFYYHSIYLERLSDIYRRNKFKSDPEELHFVDRVKKKDFKKIVKRLKSKL